MKNNGLKKALACLLALSLSLSMAAVSFAESEASRLSIVATIFPQYDWVRAVLGDQAANVELTLLLDGQTDLHSYQPTADDLVKISQCDLFIYVGGESDAWVEGALAAARNENMIVLNLMDALGEAVKTEERVEGMEAEHEHDHEEEQEHEEEHDHEEGAEADEHVWLSLKNAAVLTQAIEDALCALDSAREDLYRANAAAYRAELDALDRAYEEAVEAGAADTLLFGDRFPFRYLTDDYGLNYYAAFAGCSAETEASFETIVFLAGKMDELGLNAICVIDDSDEKIARTVLNGTARGDQAVVAFDSMQSVSPEDLRQGVTYLSMMEKNLEALCVALGRQQ